MLQLCYRCLLYGLSGYDDSEELFLTLCASSSSPFPSGNSSVQQTVLWLTIMNILPLETVTNICSNLDHQSLVNFSLCDKRNREASKTFLFQHVRIKATTGDALANLCERWSSFLQDVKSAQHVRHLSILANLQPRNPPPRRDAGPDPKPYGILLHRSDGMFADKHCDPEF